MVPRTVTSIDVTKRAIDGPDTTPKTVTVTDGGSIRSVLDAFASLSGDYASVDGQACGSPAGIVYTYAVTFHWPRHTLVLDAGEALCGIGRGLTRDGHKLPQTLADDPRLDHALAAAYRG